ncbi:MAG: phage tail sheath C-terminal domain-containing protein [Ramlibacter sp.]
MASPNISFDQIPSSNRKPGVYMEFNAKLAVRTLPSNAQRLLILAPMLATGTAPADSVTLVFSDEQAATLLGRGSFGHLMVRAAIRAYRYARISVMALADAGTGVAAAGTVTYATNSTSAGSVTVNVGAGSVTVPVASGATPTEIAAAVKAEIDKQVNWPVTATVNAGVLTLTAKNKGTLGNSIKVSAINDVTGTTVAVVAMTGGLNDPDLSTKLPLIFTASDEILLTPWANQTALTAVRTHVTDRSGPLEQRGAVVAYATTGTLSAATTLAGQINHERFTGALLPDTVSVPSDLAAAYAAVISSEEDPARPLNGLHLVDIVPPPQASRLGRVEQETCLANGVTPLEVGPGERVQIVRAITTYTLNPAGVTDIAWLDLTTIRTMDYVRKACRERVALRFPRDKLSARTPAKVRSELLDVLVKLEELEIVEEVEANKDGLIVERDSQDPNRLNAKIPVDVVNGLHVVAGRLDLLL